MERKGDKTEVFFVHVIDVDVKILILVIYRYSNRFVVHCLSPFDEILVTTVKCSGKYHVVFSFVHVCITSVIKFGNTLTKVRIR